jgi:hypothetical protein
VNIRPHKSQQPVGRILRSVSMGHAVDFELLFDRVLDVLEAALGARRIVAPKRQRRSSTIDVAVDCGPDHGAALDTVELVIRLLTVGQASVVSRPYHEYTMPELGIAIIAGQACELSGEEGEKAREQVEQRFGRPWKRAAQKVPPQLSDLIEQRCERLSKLMDRAWEASAIALGPRRTSVRNTAAVPVVLGPDHRIITRAARLLFDLLRAGESAVPPTPPPPESIEEICDRVGRSIAVGEQQTAETPALPPPREFTYVELLQLIYSPAVDRLRSTRSRTQATMQSAS